MLRNRLVLLALVVGIAPASGSEQWPQFRGADSRGISDESGLPDKWSSTDHIVWRADIPGRGWSSPIVWGKRIFLTSVVSDGKVPKAIRGLYMGGEQKRPPTDVHRWMVYCLDWDTGKVLWERVAHQGVPSTTIHIKNSYASETPVTDGERVYAYFGNQGVYCYDMEGKELWSKELGSFRMLMGWGTASSPIVYQDHLYIVDDNEEHSFLAALDTKTGKEVWRVAREEKSNWATPFLWKNDVRTELVTAGRGKVRSYSLDGKLLWELKGMSSITIPTPFADQALLYVSSGYVMDKLRPIYAIRPGASGDISLARDTTTNPYIAWSRKDAGPYNPSPLVYGDYLYVLKDGGTFACYEAQTGKEMYAKQRLGAGAFTSSPWAYDGKVFCLSEDGDTFVIQAGPQFKVLGKNTLGEMCLATPAIAHGSLILRTQTKLYRIANR